jgi:probable addiction module antidote protein
MPGGIWIAIRRQKYPYAGIDSLRYRARGMMKLAKETGITRAGLYKALSPTGNPSFETVAKIVGAFGIRLSAQAA